MRSSYVISNFQNVLRPQFKSAHYSKSTFSIQILQQLFESGPYLRVTVIGAATVFNKINFLYWVVGNVIKTKQLENFLPCSQKHAHKFWKVQIFWTLLPSKYEKLINMYTLIRACRLEKIWCIHVYMFIREGRVS